MPPFRSLAARALLAAALPASLLAGAGPAAARDPVGERLQAALSDLERDRCDPRALAHLERLAELEAEAPGTPTRWRPLAASRSRWRRAAGRSPAIP